MIKINHVFSFPITILEHMNYSTLKEAYSVDSFEKDRKKTKKSKSTRYEEEFEDAPPKSNADIKEQNIQSPQSVPKEKPINKEMPKFLNNIQPHYDEELEKYLNINDFQNANDYFPQNYDNSYYSTNYSSPDNSYGTGGNMEKYEPRQLYYRSKTQNNEPIQQLTHRPVVHYQPPPPQQSQQSVPRPQHQIERTRETFKPIERPHRYQEPQQIDDIVKKEPVDKKDTFYKNLVNIGLFIFIGILIIFLCEQITEIAINIGMKRTLMILEPYMQKSKSVKFSA